MILAVNVSWKCHDCLDHSPDMAFFSKFNWSNSLSFFGSLSPKIIVVLAENKYHGRFKAIKISKFAKFPILRKDKRKLSWKFEQNPIILSTFFGQNAKFDILTGGKISKNSPLKSDFDEICRKRSVYHCDDPVQICIWEQEILNFPHH